MNEIKKSIVEEFEFFEEGIPQFQLDKLKFSNEPSSFNQGVNVRRFKLTLELFEEEDEVIFNRCKKLYKEEDNWHNKDAIDDYSKKHFGKRVSEVIREEEMYGEED